VQALNSFNVTSVEDYIAKGIIKKYDAHYVIQNIIPSVFFMYKKINYITNIALKNLKYVINIVKRHQWKKQQPTMFTVTPVAHLRD
jgi:hypothetical protein